LSKPDSTSPSRRDDAPDEGIGGIVDDIASSWIVGDALTRLVDTGEKVVRAQQSAFSALGLPSGSQFESLTLRVRTLFHRIEELEDDLDRLERRVASLESAASAKPKSSARKPAARKPAAKKSSSK
jgi:ubiquinone biosynthesis protein UbiJ